MKTIFQIMMVLLVASIVAGAFSLAVNNSSTMSGEGGQTLAMAGTDGQKNLVSILKLKRGK